MKGAKLFLKKKNFEITIAKDRIISLQDKINDFEKEIKKIKEKYFILQKVVPKNPFELINQSKLSHYFLKKVQELNNRIDKINKTLIEEKQKLSYLNGEKKAIETFIKKQEKKEKQLETEKENRLANEIYNRKISYS